MVIRILNEIPESGLIDEKHFGVNFNNALWVEFYISEENHWFGCFSKNYENGFSKVVFDESKMISLIVAGGNGYLVNLKNNRLIYETDEHPLIESAVQSIDPNYFFVGTYYNVFVFNELGLVKEIIPDFMVDGIFLERQENGKIIGKVDSAENQYSNKMDITIDVETLEFDSLYQTPNSNFFKKIFRN